VSIKDAKGYVAVIYDSAWWVGYVLKTDPELQEVTVTFLHPHGPSKSFSYPDPADVLTVHISDLLTSVDLKTYTGRTYILTDKEMDTATKALYSHLHE
jgi:hypothetical protein